MIDAQIRRATCKVKCGDETGTGWLVTPTRVITARHCVDDAISEGAQISLYFSCLEDTDEVSATVVAEDKTLDVCILQVEQNIDLAPIVLSTALPVEGKKFTAFGFPAMKLTVGHRLEGSISQVLDSPTLGMDLDLHIDAPATLTNYKGLSGAALISDGRCKGMLRIEVDTSLGALSVARMAAFLRENSVPIDEVPQNEHGDQYFASRENFTRKLDSKIRSMGNGYIFLEGAHGIGKSTFCKNYDPLDTTLEHFGTYSFTSDHGTANAMHLAQPDVFFDWLNTLVTSYLNDTVGRVSVKSYSELIAEVDRLLTSIGQVYSSQGKTGVLFVDGLDEVLKLSEGTLERFIGLLPSKVPPGLAFIFAAPSYTNLSSALGARVGNQSCITIPSLDDNETRAFCLAALSPERISAETVRIIGERAQGHPLYLRYLIDLANGGADDEHLSGLPLINGSIRNYYETLWLSLQRDSDAVNLLAILARLRWGIPTNQLADVLTEAEQMVLVTTISRIQHLLLRQDETTIYHKSFADFLTEKTELREGDVHLRLAQYCKTYPDTPYGTVNIVYHGLKTGEKEEAYAIEICEQRWADRCVTLGTDPDTLIGDVDAALAAATHLGSFVDVIRLLLLSQRLQFRYDTLFAQSADLAATALLTLGKTREALQHAVRYGQLIIPVHEALRLAFKLLAENEIQATLKLIDKAEAVLEKQLEDTELRLADFMELFQLKIQLLLLRDRSGDEGAMNSLMGFYKFSIETIRTSISDKNTANSCTQEIAGYYGASVACLASRYSSPVSAIRERLSELPLGLEQILFTMLANYQFYCQHFGVPHDKDMLDGMFTDLHSLLNELGDQWHKPSLGIVDAIVSLGAPTALVSTLVDEDVGQLNPLQFNAADNVSMDKSLFSTGMAHWRLASLLDKDLSCPEPEEFHSTEWKKSIDLICRALAWCDGETRRVKESNDEAGLQSVWSLLEQCVFEKIQFTLAQRVEWKNSYAIPEMLLPCIYEHLTNLLTDIFPERLGFLLTFIEDRFDAQCGVYSEGFRNILSTVLENLSRLPLAPTVEDQAYALLVRWRSFVQANVKNRHELVPELMALIPLFVRLDAKEEAHSTYQALLAVSMGPSWYKEDQLELMTEALEHIPREEALETGILSRVAGLLEAASGEMTFQRFVRYNKTDLIGILCSRGDFLNAARYFLRQTCGTAEQLLAEASEGDIDRISPLRGTRFPGGALDEQAAVYRVLRSAIPTTHWPICWALLEIYQVGDPRHLEKAAEAYALVIEQAGADHSALIALVHRLQLIYESDLQDGQHEEFLSLLRRNLSPDLLESFEKLLDSAFVPCDIEKAPKVGHSFHAEVLTDAPEDQQNQRESIRDQMIMPGVFGTSSSMNDSEEALSRAERQLTRGNTSAAKAEAQTVLKHLQQGGWSIWGNLSAAATRAEDILLHKANTSDDVVKLYAPLILNERYADGWRRATHLIGRIARIATREERAAVVRLAAEHTEIIVGNADKDVLEYEFLEETQTIDSSRSLIELLKHAIDHPQWLRREKAAEMTLWLLENHPKYIPIIAPSAFTSNSSNLPDVICGVLDHLSLSDASMVWEHLAASLDFEDIIRNCKHVGRRTVLLRIVDRAARNNLANASAILESLQTAIPRPSGGANSAASNEVQCPKWALIAKHQWSELQTLGLTTTELADRATAIIKAACAPLSVDTFIDLEKLLAEGFRESANHPLGRWMAKVRYALQVALFPVATEALTPQLEQIFRPYNPVRVERLRILNFSSPSKDWLTTMNNGQRSIRPICGDDVYLDFLERIWIEDHWRLFRVTAFFYNTDPTPPEHTTEFLSTEDQAPKRTTQRETCSRVTIAPAFFGSFTPALPSDSLRQLTGANYKDLTRGFWRSGRLSESRSGGPKQEGCFLSVKNSVLRRLPDNVRLVWVYEIDGNRCGFFTYR